MSSRFPFAHLFGGVVFIVFLMMNTAQEVRAQQQPLTIEMKNVDDLKGVFATVESVDVTGARALNTGTITDLNVEEGSRVQAGAIIARVSDPKLELEIKALNAKLASIRAEQKLARTDLARAISLRKSGAGSQARLDQAETRVEVSDRALAAMKADRSVIAQRQSEGAVRAPKSGRVLDVKVTDGAVVVAGEVVASIAVESYVLRLRLPERHARSLKNGANVSIVGRDLDIPDQQQSKLIMGIVSQIYPKIESGRVVADVTVQGLGDYFVGERVRVMISTGMRKVITIPTEYLTWRFGLSFVRLDNNREVVVQVGQKIADGIEILSGLNPGDVITWPMKKPMGKEAIK